jgi:hypothetical protein
VRTIEDRPTVEGYDAAVIGCAVYMGKWLPQAQQFVDHLRATNPAKAPRPTNTTRMISVIVLVVDVCQRSCDRSTPHRQPRHRHAAHHHHLAQPLTLGDPLRTFTAPRVINMPNRHRRALPNYG